jgi:hypothetical protein
MDARGCFSAASSAFHRPPHEYRTHYTGPSRIKRTDRQAQSRALIASRSATIKGWRW